MNNTQFSRNEFPVRQFMGNVVLSALIEKEGEFDFLTAPNGACYMASLTELEEHLIELQGLYNVIVNEGESASKEAVHALMESSDCYFDEGLVKFIDGINNASPYMCSFSGIDLGGFLLKRFYLSDDGLDKAVAYCNGLRKEVAPLRLI